MTEPYINKTGSIKDWQCMPILVIGCRMLGVNMRLNICKIQRASPGNLEASLLDKHRGRAENGLYFETGAIVPPVH